MKLHLLRYFSVLAEELHFGRAAARLAITQPPLSSAIKSLEGELQVQLLVRNSKHVELTSAGAAYLAEARQILERVERAGNLAKAVAQGQRGWLSIGVTGSLLYREIPAVISQFERSHPEIDLELRELSTAEQLEALRNGQLDAGFVNALTVPPPLKSLPLSGDEFLLCLPSSHPRAKNQLIQLGQMAQEKFVMFAREIAPSNHDNVIAIFNQAGIYPRTVHAARQWLTVVAMVANGMGVAVVPSSMARSKMDGVSFVGLAGKPTYSPAVLVWNPVSSNPAMSCFLGVADLAVSQLLTKARQRR
jgi:DNA-binding transcriptional LysR family regulator